MKVARAYIFLPGMVSAGEEQNPVQFTISGYVKDARTGEVLIGATITIPGSDPRD
jgi:hypothetical protein